MKETFKLGNNRLGFRVGSDTTQTKFNVDKTMILEFDPVESSVCFRSKYTNAKLKLHEIYWDIPVRENVIKELKSKLEKL